MIIVMKDNDEAGSHLVNRLAEELGSNKVFYVSPSPGYKDINDMFVYRG